MRIVIASAAAALLAFASTLVATVRSGESSPRTSSVRHVPAREVRPSAADIEGTWTVTVNESGRIQLNLQTETSNWGHSITRDDLAGVPEATLHAATSTPAAFRIDREAGAFDMEGTFRQGRGSGHFRFLPDRGFASTLRSIGIRDADEVTDRELMTLALVGASSAELRELMALDLGTLDLRDAISLSIHRVTPRFVRDMRALGMLDEGSADRAVELRIHDITPDFVREMRSLGFGELSRRDLLQMGIHGVSADVVREYRALGFENLSVRDLVNLRIHCVTAEYVRQARAAGWDDLTPEALVDLRIHNITPAFVREMESAGYRGLSREMLMQMGIHGVTAEYVAELRELGYDDIPARRLVEMRIHGVTPGFIREVREAGFRDLSMETLVRMRIHGISPGMVRGETNP